MVVVLVFEAFILDGDDQVLEIVVVGGRISST